MGVPELNVLPPIVRIPDAAGLLRDANAGARDAFASLVRLHQGAVFSLALRMLGSRADAEEVAQDCFLKLHAELASIADALHLRHWLLRTASHRCIDRLRHRGRQPATSGTLPTDLPDDTVRETDPLLQQRLQLLLEQLPATARAVVLLRFQEDLDPTEIAALLAIPVNTVKSHLRRSLDWLRTEMTETTP